MKILQINAVYEHSSTGRTTTELHKSLLSKGIDSYVAACNISENTERLIKIGNTFDHRLHSLLSRLTGRQGHFSYLATKKLVRDIKRIAPDIVHLRVLHSNCINLPLLLKYLADKKIPVVITLHDCWLFTGHCCYFTDTKCDRWKSGCGKCPDLKNWNTSLFFDRTDSNLADKKELLNSLDRLAVIGVSDWVTSFVKDSVIKDAYIVKRIYNWIDVSKFNPTKNNVRQKFNIEKDFVVLGVAQAWGVQKGIYEFITLAKKLPDYKFLLVGKMPDQFKPLPNNIISAGVTSSVEELVNYYSAADVFFNPSTRETFGKVTVESLACGTPVVAYNLTATPELIPDGCGYVTEYQDYDSVIKYLEHIHSLGKKSFIENCTSFAHNNFVKDKLINEYIELYEDLLKK